MSLKKALIFIFRFVNSSINVNSQVDTVLYAKDSVIEMIEDCIQTRIENSDKPADNILLLTKEGKTISFSRFLKDKQLQEPLYGLVDLDSDNKKELIIYHFTGGAHCCDELYIFKTIARNKYQYAAKLHAGN